MATAAELEQASRPAGMWSYLTRRAELAAARKQYRLEHPELEARWTWPDARGWIGMGVFALSIMLLWMMRETALREDEFFQTIATVVIANGLMSVIAWAYSATKSGGELAERNAGIVDRAAGGNGAGS